MSSLESFLTNPWLYVQAGALILLILGAKGKVWVWYRELEAKERENEYLKQELSEWADFAREVKRYKEAGSPPTN